MLSMTQPEAVCTWPLTSGSVSLPITTVSNDLGSRLYLDSGGMVLVIDDMMDGPQQTVLGLAQEYVERLERIGAAVYPPVEDRYRIDRNIWNK